MGLYVFAFDDLFPKRWIELNNLDMLKIYHLFLIRIFYCHHAICIFYKRIGGSDVKIKEIKKLKAKIQFRYNVLNLTMNLKVTFWTFKTFARTYPVKGQKL